MLIKQRRYMLGLFAGSSRAVFVLWLKNAWEFLELKTWCLTFVCTENGAKVKPFHARGDEVHLEQKITVPPPTRTKSDLKVISQFAASIHHLRRHLDAQEFAFDDQYSLPGARLSLLASIICKGKIPSRGGFILFARNYSAASNYFRVFRRLVLKKH